MQNAKTAHHYIIAFPSKNVTSKRNFLALVAKYWAVLQWQKKLPNLFLKASFKFSFMLASLAYVLVLFFRSSINLIEDEVGVTLAVFNLTMGKWVCPAPPKPTDQTATQQTLPIDAPNVRAYSLENCLLSRLILYRACFLWRKLGF